MALDLRALGPSDGAPGDIDYVDQYVDDVAAIIAPIQKERPDCEIILAGHSMSGGIPLCHRR
jgi:alpha-beta hydrolase superfamily lysophospholipase